MPDPISRRAAWRDTDDSRIIDDSPTGSGGPAAGAQPESRCDANTPAGGQSGDFGRQPAFQRVDHPHSAAPQSPPPRESPPPLVEPGHVPETLGRPAETPPASSWLRLHADDLIERLQRWAEELDAREAQLNAISASQDQRERHLRIRQSNAASELAEQQRAVERLNRQRLDQPEH